MHKYFISFPIKVTQATAMDSHGIGRKRTTIKFHYQNLTRISIDFGSISNATMRIVSSTGSSKQSLQAIGDRALADVGSGSSLILGCIAEDSVAAKATESTVSGSEDVATNVERSQLVDDFFADLDRQLKRKK